MILSNCSKKDIDHALSAVNQTFSDNVKLNNYQQLSGTGLRHHVTLRVLDYSGSGAHLSRNMEPYGYKARRTTSACWHVHGRLFDALPHGTKITSNGKVTMARDMWDDFSTGSAMYPMYASDSCKCGES